MNEEKLKKEIEEAKLEAEEELKGIGICKGGCLLACAPGNALVMQYYKKEKEQEV